MQAGKSYWREKIKNMVAQFTVADTERKSQQLSLRLQQFISSYLQQHRPATFVLGGFAPLPGEPLWYLCLKKCEENLAFPRITSERSMGFYRSRREDLVREKKWGLSFLMPPASPEAVEVVPHLLLIPALGFSRLGQRLGRGKGFYDRYLQNYSGIKCGVGFREQIFAELPVEQHDQNVDLIVTECELITVTNNLSTRE